MKVGITGHQDLNGDLIKTRAKVREVFLSLDPTVLVSCLAIGADQLLAELAIENNVALCVIVPCYQYEDSFDQDGLLRYQRLLKDATSVIELDYISPNSQAYWAAGKKLVEQCDTLITLWNGRPARGLGGTADVVELAIGHGKPVIHIVPRTLEIKRY